MLVVGPLEQTSDPSGVIAVKRHGWRHRFGGDRRRLFCGFEGEEVSWVHLRPVNSVGTS